VDTNAYHLCGPSSGSNPYPIAVVADRLHRGAMLASQHGKYVCLAFPNIICSGNPACASEFSCVYGLSIASRQRRKIVRSSDQNACSVASTAVVGLLMASPAVAGMVPSAYDIKKKTEGKEGNGKVITKKTGGVTKYSSSSAGVKCSSKAWADAYEDSKFGFASACAFLTVNLQPYPQAFIYLCLTC
jgi:hypothetical protein